MRKAIIFTIFIIMFTLYLHFVNLTFTDYSKQEFYSSAKTLFNMFEYKVLSGGIIVKDNLQYITFKDAQIRTNDKYIDYNKSYIAFKKIDSKNVYYLTIVGTDKYKNFAYQNIEVSKIDELSTISNNIGINISELIQNINAEEY